MSARGSSSGDERERQLARGLEAIHGGSSTTGGCAASSAGDHARVAPRRRPMSFADRVMESSSGDAGVFMSDMPPEWLAAQASPAWDRGHVPSWSVSRVDLPLGIVTWSWHRSRRCADQQLMPWVRLDQPCSTTFLRPSSIICQVAPECSASSALLLLS